MTALETPALTPCFWSAGEHLFYSETFHRAISRRAGARIRALLWRAAGSASGELRRTLCTMWAQLDEALRGVVEAERALYIEELSL